MASICRTMRRSIVRTMSQKIEIEQPIGNGLDGQKAIRREIERQFKEANTHRIMNGKEPIKKQNFKPAF